MWHAFSREPWAHFLFASVVAGLEKSLGLQTYDFNIGACIYYIIYLFADIPGGLAVKKFGFWIVPAATLSFGLVTMATAFIHNRGSFL